MTDPNGNDDRGEWDELVRDSIADRSDIPSQRGRSVMHTAAVAAVAFGMGALTVTAVLFIQENGSDDPVLASVGSSPDPAMAVEREEARRSRPVRDVLVEPNVDPSALQQDPSGFAERVRPALEAQRPDESATPEPAREPLAADRQDARVGPRPYVRPRDDAPAQIAAPAPAEAPSETPPALEGASSESAAAPGLARVRSAVNIRSGPDKASEAIGVVPADALLQVVSCEGWCEVIYNGQRGFIYESFIDGPSQ